MEHVWVEKHTGEIWKVFKEKLLYAQWLCVPSSYKYFRTRDKGKIYTRKWKKSSGVRKSSLKAKGGWKNWGEEWKKGHLMTWKEHVQRHAPFFHVLFSKRTCLLRAYCWQSWRWLWRSIFQDRPDLTWHSGSVRPLGATLWKTLVYFALLPSLGDLHIASHVVLHLKLLRALTAFPFCVCSAPKGPSS